MSYQEYSYLEKKRCFVGSSCQLMTRGGRYKWQVQGQGIGIGNGQGIWGLGQGQGRQIKYHFAQPVYSGQSRYHLNFQYNRQFQKILQSSSNLRASDYRVIRFTGDKTFPLIYFLCLLLATCTIRFTLHKLFPLMGPINRINLQG